MAAIEKSVLVEYTQAEMFTLVDDVEHYPLFLPWCESVELHERNELRTVATLHLNYFGIKAKFSTENTKEFPGLMTIRLREGLFRNLDGTWRFTALGETACKTEFKLHYEFANRALELAIGPVFNMIANTFIDSFVKRAQTLHG